eukprot:CAMPEP_0174315744 /NCGR_PEP_ID=MMETSP0810-20121108/6477_1 /TAXON_ID=73025 ORGANISM="Eutreptiella gymnastica-like, Strain CCMP1594" /NCGR_SAMPLE_ID=MMETSP0810 /ASSEMBLY_ACC=CAM_ASM_000659 /LENGTH=520 /DNA_ID=CAMNT_0015425205 /DNA_START=53 /DNA_END=1615 /DNA_ORIENTATION=-
MSQKPRASGPAEDKGVVARTPEVHWKTWYYGIVASASEIADGLDIGAFSWAVMAMTSEEQADPLYLTAAQKGLIVAEFNFVAGLGCLLAGPVSDAMGRKTTLITGVLLNVIGTIITMCSGNFGVLFLGRFIMGLGAGISFVDPELYCSEIVPAHVRGKVNTFAEMFINLGIVIGYAVGWAAGLNWRLTIGIGAILPAIVFFLLFTIPESPRWLTKKNRIDRAKDGLRTTADYTEEELDALIADIQRTIAHENVGWGSAADLLNPCKLLRNKCIGWGLGIGQQINMSEGVVYFTPTILTSAGVTDSTVVGIVTLCVGLCKCLFCLIPMFLVDRVGRKVLLYISNTGLWVMLFLMGAAFAPEYGGGSFILPLAAVALPLYMAFFSFGWGALPGVYMPEAFPLHVRGQAVGVGWGLNRFASGLVGAIFLPLTEAIGKSTVMFIFGAVVIILTFFLYYVVPETMNLQLEKVQDRIDVGRDGKDQGFADIENGPTADTQADEQEDVRSPLKGPAKQVEDEMQKED